MALRARIDTPLKRALLEDGRRQDWLAARIGANADQVSKWVNGVHVPVEATREAIARELGRHVDDLFPMNTLQDAA